MRINRFIAQSTGLSRRSADKAIAQTRVEVNGKIPDQGYLVTDQDVVTLDGHVVKPPDNRQTIILNKPVGYVCSRDGQGSRTIYGLLPPKFHHLKPVGRLDKDSEGLLLLTNDGQLANQLTHPRYEKEKVYQIKLDKALANDDKEAIMSGVELYDGISKLILESPDKAKVNWRVRMTQGRNRQIRRTFESLNYRVVRLNRIQFGEYILPDLKTGTWQLL